ncbi:uncharacterized protein MYCGRDRAFT_97983 [Zymoseptoria tritici IPO323]|uniref:Uncharacterized protein n=1 Tax=Zymoseptoria tritici (strain CBS 115943 / IPO323) TaxID=336722 RepID=F9XRZ3_ZYMTI|nr:uncharacterized protein MYCGRDRAFT_97983 [Zymoseptoria tritici IPO323]EGP82017.1 hypothetical protein MYCGRDRAFT_97983 [Zymoseptoria tritici IPO323]
MVSCGEENGVLMLYSRSDSDLENGHVEEPRYPLASVMIMCSVLRQSVEAYPAPGKDSAVVHRFGHGGGGGGRRGGFAARREKCSVSLQDFQLRERTASLLGGDVGGGDVGGGGVGGGAEAGLGGSRKSNEPVHTSGESVRAQPGFACARPFCPMGPHPQDGRPQLSDSQTVQLVYGLGKGHARAAAQVSVCAKRLYRAGRRETGLGLGLPSAKSVEA